MAVADSDPNTIAEMLPFLAIMRPCHENTSINQVTQNEILRVQEFH